ncbi:hypothetical protein [Streptomyces sp.]|uniref:hypothetical protein n=1 Tax=Streptomyces sp. TaxID=1931 RepID=UPI002812754A|nr:hypothetical protein [Streptomyces sp.]
MSDGEQDYGARRAYQQRCAQVQAYDWATRATAEYNQAIRHEDDARARQHHDNAWQRDRMADEQRLAKFHGVRTTEALRLAEMWARVALALADGELPVTSVLEVRGQHPDADGAELAQG